MDRKPEPRAKKQPARPQRAPFVFMPSAPMGRINWMAVLFQDGHQPSTTPIGLYESSMPGSTGKRFFVE